MYAWGKAYLLAYISSVLSLGSNIFMSLQQILMKNAKKLLILRDIGIIVALKRPCRKHWLEAILDCISTECPSSSSAWLLDPV